MALGHFQENNLGEMRFEKKLLVLSLKFGCTLKFTIHFLLQSKNISVHENTLGRLLLCLAQPYKKRSYVRMLITHQKLGGADSVRRLIIFC